jgi:hypothetical protein
MAFITKCTITNDIATSYEFGLMNGFIDYLQVVTTNICNAISISTLYSSLEHTQSSVLSLLLDVPW